METEEVLLVLFELQHGPISGSCSIKIAYRDEEFDNDPYGVHLCKDGNVCWTATSTDLLLWYVGEQLLKK